MAMAEPKGMHHNKTIARLVTAYPLDHTKTLLENIKDLMEGVYMYDMKIEPNTTLSITLDKE